MERGLAAPLSPKEKVALGRVVLAPCALKALDKHYVDRLLLLKLIAIEGETLKATPLGRKRIELNS